MFFCIFFLFFFNDTATTEIYTLSLHDALSDLSVELNGIRLERLSEDERAQVRNQYVGFIFQNFQLIPTLTALENVMVPLERSEEHTSELQSRQYLVCRLLLEKKKYYINKIIHS